MRNLRTRRICPTNSGRSSNRFRAMNLQCCAGPITDSPHSDREDHSRSFQAYLDEIEEMTGKTPNEFISSAREKGFEEPGIKAQPLVDSLREDFGLGGGHATALVQVIKNGPEISDQHVGSIAAHRAESGTLKLDGSKRRASQGTRNMSHHERAHGAVTMA